MTKRELKIKAKAILGLPLTTKERAIYLLLLANNEEIERFLDNEKNCNI